MTASMSGVLTAVASLGAVLGLIWLSQALVRRTARFRNPASEPGRLAVVQSLALDPRRRLQLIRCDGRHMLLLTGGPQDLMLGFLSGADQP